MPEPDWTTAPTYAREVYAILETIIPTRSLSENDIEEILAHKAGHPLDEPFAETLVNGVEIALDWLRKQKLIGADTRYYIPWSSYTSAREEARP
jgi:hypothetical protein